ncbi:unnamed protein product [Ixodes persulcatus]
MSALLAQLGGNPFNTVVGQKIEQATDASLASENWALNMEICDIVNDTDEGPKDAIRALRKRLTQNAGKNYTVVMYSLTVLETCVKNCGRRFHLLVAQKDFVQELVKMIGPKNDPPTAVQEKVLSLIQSWADAFRVHPEMQGVVQVYSDLKNKGVEFPMTDLDTMAPIHTPQRSVPMTAAPPSTLPGVRGVPMAPAGGPVRPLPQQPGMVQVGSLPPSPVTLGPEQLEKLKRELEVVQRNMTVFGEMLSELVPGQEQHSDWELLQELQKTCHAMQTRVVDLVDKVANEEVTGELLRLNDDLNNLFLRYERFEKRRTAIVTGQAKEGPAVPAPTEAAGRTAGRPFWMPGFLQVLIPVRRALAVLARYEVLSKVRKLALEAGHKDPPLILNPSTTTGNVCIIQETRKTFFRGSQQKQRMRNRRNRNAGGAGANVGPLIDLGEPEVTDDFQKLALGVTASAGSNPAAKPSGDEFDMFAQSRHVGLEPGKAGGSSYADNTSVDQLGVSLGALAQVRGQKPVEPATGQESITSTAEFDRFLAERAAAAERLPPAASATSGPPGPPTPAPVSIGGPAMPPAPPPSRNRIERDEKTENSLFAL